MFRSIVAAGLLVFVPFTAMGQEEKTVAQLDKEIATLKADLKATAEHVTTLMETVGKNTDAIGAMSSSLEEILAQQAVVLDRLEETMSIQQEQFTQQQMKLDSIVQKDSQGAEVLRLSAISKKSEEFRKELSEAVHESLRKQGQVIIRNKTSESQSVLINQESHEVPAGQVVTLPVPVGTLTAQLLGQPYTNWTITAPKYEQTIDIIDAPKQVTTQRPISESTVGASSAVTTYRPVYTEVPVYVDTTTYYVDPMPIYWYSNE